MNGEMRKRMFCALLILALALLCQPAFTQETPPPQEESVAKDPDQKKLQALEEEKPLEEAELLVKYYIDARLFPDQSRLEGEETLTWMNTTDKPASTLRFHLYYNAFRDENSTFMTDAKYFGKSAEELSELRFGGIKVQEMRVMGGEELTEKITFIQPDDNNEHDQTVIEVALDQPVEPGQSISLKIEFQLQIPEIFARTGQEGDYFFFGQWFPKIGVFQENGEWNCHQFHRTSEFFADYGEYKVSLSVPEEFVIGATGNLVNKKKDPGGIYTYYFEEKNIHDFAWVAYPHFTRVVEKIKLEGNDEETTIILLLSPHHEVAKERYLKAIKYSLEFFAEHLFPYPYKNITVVDPPLGAMKSAGMEYPTLITAGYVEFMPKGMHAMELVTMHEFGHEYWYGIIGSDEFREAWLDEGVNSFFELEMMDGYFENEGSMLNSALVKIDNIETKRQNVAALLPVDKVNQYSWKFMSGGYYSAHVYDKAALVLDALKHLVGKNKMYEFFKYYARQFKFKHPTTNDFIQTFNKFMGEDFTWVFDLYINGEAGIDNAVQAVRSYKIGADPDQYRNEVVFVRKDGYFPVDLLVKLKNGEEIKYYWQEREKWKKLSFQHEFPVDYAIIDPQLKIKMDKDLVNNSRIYKGSGGAVSGWAVRLGFVVQNLLSLLVL
jgi:hypothetical protein